MVQKTAPPQGAQYVHSKYLANSPAALGDPAKTAGATGAS